MYGSVDIINVCNLHCTHCYCWLNRKNDSNDEGGEEQWREIINYTTRMKEEKFWARSYYYRCGKAKDEIIRGCWIMQEASYIMKTPNNEPQKRVNDLYPLLQIIMRPKREIIPQ
jgi:hypothetical protein